MSDHNRAATDSLIAVALLLRPQGRRGELLAEPLTDQLHLLRPGAVLTLRPGTHAAPLPSTVSLLGCWQPTGRNASRIVLELEGCDSITRAEAFAGAELLLPASALPTLEPGTWFVQDLVGCILFDGDIRIGTVTHLEFPTTADGRRQPEAAPLLAVTPGSGSAPAADPQDTPEPILVPFIRAWIDTVDTTAKRIVMHLPEGLANPPTDDDLKANP